MATYLATLFEKYGLNAEAIGKASGCSKQCAYNWSSGRSLPMARYLPAVVRMLKKYEPTLTLDKLMEREMAGRPAKQKPRKG